MRRLLRSAPVQIAIARLAPAYMRLDYTTSHWTVVYVIGEPVHVPGGADSTALEVARRMIETRLNQLTRDADRLCGRAPAEPAEPHGLASPA